MHGSENVKSDNVNFLLKLQKSHYLDTVLGYPV